MVRATHWIRRFVVSGCAALLACGTLDPDSPDATVPDGSASDAFTDAGASCGLAVSDPSCRSCLEANCCEEMAACGSDSECEPYESCVQGCGADYGCRASCAVQNPNGGRSPEVPPLEVCAVTHCESACGVSCGLVGALAGAPAQAAACSTCIAGSPLCAAAEACGRSLECSEVAQCVGACPTQDCKQACDIGRDAGAALLSELETLFGGDCLTPCAFGEDWTCVGKVDVPVANGVSTSVSLKVATIEGTVVPGATVRACSAADFLCTQALQTATTDSSGVAELTVEGPLVLGAGFDGYFEITPAVDPDAQAAVLVPLLYFLSYPLSEPAVSLNAVGLTPSDLASLTAAANVSVGDAGATGDLFLITLDCELDPAPGATLAVTDGTLDLTSQLRYIDLGAKTVRASGTTDSSGSAVVFGVPALQSVAITATRAQVTGAVGSAQAFVRAGALSVISAVPY